MILEITNETRIRQIKAEFSTSFPYLQITFFAAPSNSHANQHEIHSDSSIGSISPVDEPLYIAVNASDTISDTEKKLGEKLKLLVKILRKSNSHWVKPGDVDALTLREQNSIGRISSEHFLHPDYDSRIEDEEY